MPYSRRGRKLKWMAPAATMLGYGAAAFARRAGGRLGGRLAAGAVRALGGRNVTAGFRRLGYGVAGTTAGAPIVAGAAGYIAGRRRKMVQGRKKSTNYRPQAEMGKEIKKTLVVGPQVRMSTHERRLQKISTSQRILRFQAVNPLNRVTGSNDTPGWFQLQNDKQATYTAVPMHLISLTNTVNNVSTTNGPMFRTYVNDDGTLLFGNANGRTIGSDSAVTTDWQVEYNDIQRSKDYGWRFIQPEWIDVRFNLYGAKSQPTIYDIQVVKFADDYLDPLENPSNTKEGDDRLQFWQGLVRPFMYNPILPNESGSFIRKKLKVIHRTRVTIQPTLNTELDVTPASQIVKFFIKDGKVYDYMYHGEGFTGAGADDKLNTDRFDEEPSALTDYSDQPQAKARYWIILRALNTTFTTSGSGQTALNTPSYDVVIRKKERVGIQNDNT